MEVFLDTKTAEEHRCIALGIPAFHLSELVLELSDTITVLVVEVGLSIEGVLLLHDRPEDTVPHQDGIHDGEGIEGMVILAEYREALTRTQSDRATGRLKGTTDRA